MKYWQNRRVLSFLLVLALALSLVGCQSSAPSQPDTPPNEAFDAFLEELFVDAMSDNIVDLHFSLKNPAALGIQDVPVTWGGYSLAYLAEEQAESSGQYDRLQAFDRSSLDQEQQLIYDKLDWNYETSLMGEAFSLYAEPNSSTQGIQTLIPTLLPEYILEDEQDVRDYIALVYDAKRVMEEAAAIQRQRSREGLFMSRKMADLVLSAASEIIAEPDQLFLVTHFEERLAALSFLNDTQKEQYKEEHKKAITEGFLPGYELLIREIDVLKDTGKNAGGIAGLENGKEYYRYLFRQETGSERSVEETISLLDTVQKETESRLTGLLEDPELFRRFVDETMSTEQVEGAEILEELEEKIQADYPSIEKVAYRIQEIPPAMAESSSPAHYISPLLDATGENSISLNPSLLVGRAKTYVTLAHEGYPGHLYQLNYFYQHIDDLLHKSLNYSGYLEGWANYVELASYDYLYPDDPELAEVMRLYSIDNLLTQCRLELGIHFEGWDRDVLYDRLSSLGIDRQASDDFYTFILDYAGSTLKYAVGYLEMMELRTLAEEELGSRFVEKEFHQALLDVGPAPFAVVKTAVEAYIAAAK